MNTMNTKMNHWWRMGEIQPIFLAQQKKQIERMVGIISIMRFYFIKVVVHMLSDWDWRSKNKHEKEKRHDELWNVWWTVCTAEFKRKTE